MIPAWLSTWGGVVAHAVLITGFVFIMMLVIEYLNVLTRGRWQAHISRWTWGQTLFAALLGAVPGCLGAYAVTSLYMHRVVTVGAVVAAMIATSGDEAFVMLAMFPGRALALTGMLLVIGIIAGLATDALSGARRTRRMENLEHYHPTHPEQPACVPFSWGAFLVQWRPCSPYRALLVLLLVLFTAGVLTGVLGHGHAPELTGAPPSPSEHLHSGHDHASDHADPTGASLAAEHGEHGDHGSAWNWIRITLLLAGLAGLFITVTVPDHFLIEHLWRHLFRVHVWRIFLWTLGALMLIHLLDHWIDISEMGHQHSWMLLILACLLGLVPESGPHLVFVALFAEGSIPFSVLLASSIVQDGHGMIPMLAHSRLAFIGIKAINFAVGLTAGAILLTMGG